MLSGPTFVALGSRLRGIPEVETLGVKPNYLDYTDRERARIAGAPVIFYPTRLYAEFFTTMGKPTFPSLETYLYADEKIKQTTLFYLLGIPHPRTRIYFRRHRHRIQDDFSFPFVAKIPRRSARGRGVFLVQDTRQLEHYLAQTPVAYVQEHLPHDRDLRVILIGYRPVLAYWRLAPPGDFRTNLSLGGTPCFERIPPEALRLAEYAARQCRFNDVGLDLIQTGGRWQVLEANMKYGRRALRMKGLDLKEILRRKLLAGELWRDHG